MFLSQKPHLIAKNLKPSLLTLSSFTVLPFHQYPVSLTVELGRQCLAIIALSEFIDECPFPMTPSISQGHLINSVDNDYFSKNERIENGGMGAGRKGRVN